MNKMLNELDLPKEKISNKDTLEFLKRLNKDLATIADELDLLVTEKINNENR